MSNDTKQNQAKGPTDLDEDMNEIAGAFAEFLRDPTNKRRFHLFLLDYYKELETEKVDSIISRLNTMRESDQEHQTDVHEPSNISDLLQDTFSIKEAEAAFVETLGFAKKSLDRAAEGAAQEIRNALHEGSGIHEQVAPWYAKYIAAYLQFRDHKRKHRDMMILSVHMRKDDLDPSWFSKDGSISDCWDHAVATMTQILNDGGLKVTYVKNDRQDRLLVMRQELVSTTSPDEYFAIRLEYETPERLKIGVDNYEKMKLFYQERVHALQHKLMKQTGSAQRDQIARELRSVRHEQDFFLGTVPDPKQLGEGILLTLELSSTQDYHLIRNKLQMIVSTYLDLMVKDDGERGRLERQKQRLAANEDVIEYEVDVEHLRPVRRRKSS
ncbi:hypothetical protein [Oligoflexus tunisiensis]|uniref:hypothetical protein n=1 Tax=Oligoflexus tunisiensis TaxID=708132 RepID=UPI00114CA293|nr:hypothetical protein [Oligoflexus tunisiensis]